MKGELLQYIIADSSGLVSLASVTDSNHSAAVGVAERFVKTSGVIIVPGEVLAETLNILGKKVGKPAAIKTGKALLESTIFAVEQSNEQIIRDAFTKFEKLPASVSFTDCIVMAFADFYHGKQTYIFGFDEVFAKQGYPSPK